MLIPLVGESQLSISSDSNSQRCVNMFPISVGKDGRGGGALIPSPGLQSLIDLNGTEGRGIISIGDYVYVVVDDKLYKLTINTTTLETSSTLLGTLNTSVGVVRFSTNPTQLMIVDGSADGYIVTLSTGAFATISDADFVGGTHVIFCDGYFMYNEPNTAFIRVSAINDGLTYDALDVASVESKPDNLVGLAVNKGEVWCFGEKTVEVWYDAANPSGMPFSPRVGSEIDMGCAAPYSILELENLIMWLDSRGMIVQSQISPYIRDQSSGYDLKIVSDEAMNSAIASYGTISDAIATTYNDRGHIMYHLTFPSERKTWVYDHATNVWTERAYYDTTNNRLIEHLITHCTSHKTLNLGCSHINGKVYLMAKDIYSDDGVGIRRIRTTSPFSSEGKFITVNQLTLRIKSGYALSTGEGSDPMIAMRYSNDGGHTWSNEEARSAGRIGEYGIPITWNRLGTAREWVFEFTMVSPIDFSFMEGSIDVTIDKYS